jgi:hypothetical protein
MWVSKTGAGLLQQVKTRLEVSAALDEDSFCLFLHLLGKHLMCCMTHNQQRHWQQMKGRIYSKIPPNKLRDLTELGLYHFVSLFLTLAVTVDLQEVVSLSQIYSNFSLLMKYIRIQQLHMQEAFQKFSVWQHHCIMVCISEFLLGVLLVSAIQAMLAAQWVCVLQQCKIILTSCIKVHHKMKVFLRR